MKKLSLLFVPFYLILVFAGCASTSTADFSATSLYCTKAELKERKSAVPLLENALDWELQYPSGSANEGMLKASLSKNFKSKYLSLFEDAAGTQYIRFSLAADDEGKSPNGSSVRAELRNHNDWTLSDTAELSYTFFITSTDFTNARFTVGQFLQHCAKKDSPLCRIEVEDGTITAKVANYQEDGITKADSITHNYPLGTFAQKEEVSIRLCVKNKTLSIFRGGELKATHTFADSVSGTRGNYFKAGIYYQNRDSPHIFSEVFLRNLKTKIE